MALEGTHIRFALDVKDKYQVKDLGKYLSGTIYPDSRYPLGTERKLTHPDDFENWNVLELDDFRKGWYAHLLYDRIQYKFIAKILNLEGYAPQYSDDWVRLSAIKTLQNVDDIQKVDIRPYLRYLDHTENPNGEDLELLRQYNQSVHDMYLLPPTLENSILSWKDFIVPAELVAKVKRQTIEFSQNESMMSQIKKLYDETLKIA